MGFSEPRQGLSSEEGRELDAATGGEAEICRDLACRDRAGSPALERNAAAASAFGSLRLEAGGEGASGVRRSVVVPRRSAS
jgi:hypothetical protein